MKPILKGFLIAGMLFLSLSQFGCVSLGAVGTAVMGAPDAGALDTASVEATSSPKTTLVVLVDVSHSTLSQRKQYVQALARVLATVTPGTTVLVCTITRDSLSAGQVLAEETVPGFRFTPAPDPPTDNPMLLAKHRTQERQRFSRSLASFEASTSVEAVRRNVVDRASHTILTADESRTDILGGLSEAGRLFSAAGSGGRRLVVLSDGVRNDPSADFGGLTSVSDARRFARADESAGRVADLRGVNVLFVGANADGVSRRYDALETYWVRYFGTAHAQMRPAWYGRPLTDVVLNQWASQ